MITMDQPAKEAKETSMFPKHLSHITFYQKKKDILLFSARDGADRFMLKCAPLSSSSSCLALEDEYEVLSRFHHPAVPEYYGISTGYEGLPVTEPLLCVCMEFRDGVSLRQASADLSLKEIVDIVIRTGHTLHALLQEGILYTDLHPSNILVEEDGSLSLLDFTCCYYYLHNPNPSYSLRFSYHLDPALKGQQLLIQEITFLLNDLLEEKSEEEGFQSLPHPLYTILTTGSAPTESLSLPDYLHLLEESIV